MTGLDDIRPMSPSAFPVPSYLSVPPPLPQPANTGGLPGGGLKLPPIPGASPDLVHQLVALMGKKKNAR